MSQYPPPGGYPPPPPGDYPPPPGNYPPGPQPQQGGGRGLAITSLVLGILAVVTFCTMFGGVILGVLAVIFGLIAVLQARSGRAGGRGMALAGLVLGAIALIGSLVMGWYLWSHGMQDYFDCVNRAGNNNTAVQQCVDNFQDRLGVKHHSA
ncbi:DUF4190 domain-containing protein [Nocardia stercoris]|uniref:DUF4190 domain-containing protein n=1 Tax=Nocardia stercoris TaxID=2483361 RepID=A0A3M2LDN1_9NOCA|nr:DUF4190 domain-containing protein [Nocardia stercoris]RMI34075.1 DUF4190 domain-containing protein [Nocardia stercoris]